MDPELHASPLNVLRRFSTPGIPVHLLAETLLVDDSAAGSTYSAGGSHPNSSADSPWFRARKARRMRRSPVRTSANLGIFASPVRRKDYSHPNKNKFNNEQFRWEPTQLTGKHNERFQYTTDNMVGEKTIRFLYN